MGGISVDNDRFTTINNGNRKWNEALELGTATTPVVFVYSEKIMGGTATRAKVKELDKNCV